MNFAVENGTFEYKRTKQQVLKNITFEISSGNVTAILGPNGAGKTTLLRCALGFLKWKSGRAVLDGEDVSGINPRELWRKIAYVPQARQTVSPYTVEETVLLGRNAFYGFFEGPKRTDYEKADQVIEKMRLSDIRFKNCSEISGGELQMVLIARALAAEPKMLVLDEPESNLDFKNQLLVLDTISELAAEGTACLFNTHYPAHALRRADKSLLLGKNGTCVWGDTAKIVTEENIGKFFGVNAVIGEIETETNSYRDVVPISFSDGNLYSDGGAEAVATLSIIISDVSAAPRVNSVIHSAVPFIVGRMGMPMEGTKLHIINLVLKAPMSEIQTISDAVNRIKGVSAKVTYARSADYE